MALQTTISTTSGPDNVQGTAGADVVDAGSGADIVHGEGSADVIDGGTGQDKLYGDDGEDIINGGGGDDRVAGGAGEDVLFGGQGDDRLIGGQDADWLIGGAGNDIMYAGDANSGAQDAAADVLFFDEDDGSDKVYGFEVGVDSIVLDGVSGYSLSNNGGTSFITFGATTITIYNAILTAADISYGDVPVFGDLV